MIRTGNTFKRATNMAAAFVNAVVKQDAKQKCWVSRAVVDRAMHTNIGDVVEADRISVSNKTAALLGIK